MTLTLLLCFISYLQIQKRCHKRLLFRSMNLARIYGINQALYCHEHSHKQNNTTSITHIQSSNILTSLIKILPPSMNPSDCLMLMIASSSEKSTYEGKRRQADQVPPQKGPPLPGIKHDLKAFRNKFKMYTNHYIETSQDEKMLLTKSYILNWLEKYFCQATYQTFIFFSGHGCQGGDWALETVENPHADLLRLDTIINLWLSKRPMQKCHLYIIMDSCYSGAWTYKLSDMGNKGISIFASSDRNETSIDCNGGLLMKSILGPENQIQDTYRLIKKYQNPVFINKTDRVAKIEVSHLKQLNQNIGNVLNVLSAGSPYSGVATNVPINPPPTNNNPPPNTNPNNNPRPPPPNTNTTTTTATTNNNPRPPPPTTNTTTYTYTNSNTNSNPDPIRPNPYRPPNTFTNLSNLNDINSLFNGPSFSSGGNNVYTTSNVYYYNNGKLVHSSGNGNGNMMFNGINLDDYDFGDSNTVYMYMDRNGKIINQTGGGKKNKKSSQTDPTTTSTASSTPQVVMYNNGQKYTGTLQNNKKHGKGTFEYASGTKYIGQWQNDLKNGEGSCQYSNGDKYVGDWLNDKRHGKGVYLYFDGRRYEGDWKDNVRTGKGKFYFVNGDVYDGDWVNQKQEGHGVYKYKDGKIYTGEWKDNKFNGFGTMQFPNGNKYEGDWQNDKKHGHGIFDHVNGDSYDGDWVNDVKEGYGIYYFVNGDQYEGDFARNKFNGQGSYYYADGSQDTGRWVDDQYIGP